MTITRAITLLGKWGRKIAPTTLAIAGSAGVIVTGISAAKAGMAYERTKDKRVFIKPVITGAVTITCILTGDRIHVKRNAAIAGTAALVERKFRDYRDICTPDVDQIAMNEVNEKRAEDIWKKCQQNGIKPIDTHTGDILWFEPESMTWFLASEDHVKNACYHTNRNFKLRGHESFNEWLGFLGLPDEDLSFEQYGWFEYEGEVYYGYTWIDFEFHDKKLRDGTEYKEIFYPFGPHLSEK